jgi:hypothetical protein
MLKLARMAAFAALTVLLSQRSTSAQVLDPPNLHINGPGGFAQGVGGTDWVTLPSFGGVFNIQDVSSASETITPWHLVIAIPNVTLTPPGSILDDITQIGTTTLATPITNDSETTLTSGQDAYVQLNVPGTGLPNSMSFTNFALADATIHGPFVPQSYGLYDFTVSAAQFALLSGAGPENITLGDGLGGAGLLPTGSVIFAWGIGDNGKTFSTSFTNAGVATPQSLSQLVPEPSTMIIAAVGGVGFVGYAVRRRRASRIARA